MLYAKCLPKKARVIFYVRQNFYRNTLITKAASAMSVPVFPTLRKDCLVELHLWWCTSRGLLTILPPSTQLTLQCGQGVCFPQSCKYLGIPAPDREETRVQQKHASYSGGKWRIRRTLETIYYQLHNKGKDLSIVSTGNLNHKSKGVPSFLNLFIWPFSTQTNYPVQWF